MTGNEFKAFREKYFHGKMSKEKMAVEFGVKYHTLRRYDGDNSNPVPEVLQKAMQFFEEKETMRDHRLLPRMLGELLGFDYTKTTPVSIVSKVRKLIKEKK